MGAHTMQQDTDRLTGRGLLGRGAMTGLAALALVGGGAGVALADEAPADAGHDATQSQSHDSGKSSDDSSKGSDASKSSDEGKSSDSKGADQGSSPLSSVPGADALSSLPTSLPASASSLPSLSGMNVGSVQQAGQAPQAAGAAQSLPIASSILG